MRKLLIMLFLSLGMAVSANAGTCHVLNLNKDWSFKQARLNNWHPATVPGTVHTDLMALGMIDDPFIGLNEKEVQWVDKEDWEYRTVFDAEGAVGSRQALLVFHGLDTYADIFLNDSLILKADNMFRTWKVDVAALLKEKGNVLRIYFHSPIKVDMEKWHKLDYQYNAVNDQSQNGGVFDRRLSVFARKAGYHYGWDWGPRLVTSGVWRPIELVLWNDVRIDDVYTRQQTTSKLSQLSQCVTVMAENEGEATVMVTDKATGKKLASKVATLHKGKNEVTLDFQIKNPRLWWTNGLGEAHLYTFATTVTMASTTDCREQRIGLRSIRVLNEKDEYGKEFCFELNGKRVFMKGSDYIPCDNFLPRVSDEIYTKTIQDAVDVNMNMIRVWGGGIYENDLFYDLCDEKGILIWQDFMFACSVYPASGALLESIQQEARDNIIRLRNHPCIALWCGNNECQDSFYGWGWREAYYKQSQEIGQKVEREFTDLYYKVLPQIVEELNPDIKYWPSSPFGDYNKSSFTTSGDYHYWGVWHANEPISNYNVHRARFYSEYGMQSFPEFESVKAFATDPAQWDIHSDMMMSHQRGGSFANSRIEGYLESEYVKPAAFPALLYVGQLMQGDAMKTAVEAHRRDKGYCWGTLIWQINDCWPVASWSTRDWYGRWKAAHYMIRHAMDDVLVSPIEKEGRLDVYVVNDRLKAVKGKLCVKLMTLDGKCLKEVSKQITAAANSSASMYSVPVDELLAGADRKDVFVAVDFNADRLYTADYCLLKSKNMAFPKANINWSIEENADGSRDVVLKSDCYVRGVFLSLPEEINPFHDNYVNLLPGKEFRIRIDSKTSTADISRHLSVSAYNNL